MAERLLRLPDVKDRVGLARSTIYLRVSNGTFPSPIKLGEHTVAWMESEITAWIDARIQQSRTRSEVSK